MYEVKYLPRAKENMVSIVKYISKELSNPLAAEKLANEMIAKANILTTFPYSNSAYQPIRPLKKEYRRFRVRNYNIFYWIDEKKKQVTIGRVIYSRRNYEKLL